MRSRGDYPWNKGGTSWNKGKKSPWAGANGFKTGHSTWNKGLKNWMSEEGKKRMIAAKIGKTTWMKGRKHTKKAKRIIGEKALGRIAWNKGTIGVMKPNSGSFTSEQMEGEKHPNWHGGISKLPYAHTFTKKLKEQIKIRDGFICLLCKSNKDLVIHHIDYNKMNCKSINLVTLCRSHNSIVNCNRNSWKTKIKKLLQNSKKRA